VFSATGHAYADGVRDDRCTKRMGAEFFGLLAFGALVLGGILFFVAQAVNSADDLLTIGPPPSRDQRREIERANCKQLIQLEYRYTPNDDSVDPDMTLLRLTDERLAKLHCALPPALQLVQG